MFDLEFYPTPLETIERMLNGYDIQGKIILEPSAGTGHFEFKDEKLWHQFNQHVARIKGYPLYEGKSKK